MDPDSAPDAADLSGLVRTMPEGFEIGWKYLPPEGVGNTEEHSILEDLLDIYIMCISILKSIRLLKFPF